MKCELVEESDGWILSHFTHRPGVERSYSLGDVDEADAQLIAIDLGFTEIRVYRINQPATTVTVPKSPYP
jgi:hypothetical protein